MIEIYHIRLICLNGYNLVMRMMVRIIYLYCAFGCYIGYTKNI